MSGVVWRVALVTRVPLAAILSLVAIGCESPEATRNRGGGPGADPQNRPALVKMHEGSDPFWKTPPVLDDVVDEDEDRQEELLEAARHARQRSVEP